MDLEDTQRFDALRERVFRHIEKCLKEDGHHKHYEGAWDVSVSYPNYFEQEKRVQWTLTLHCYLIGDGRHHDWSGKTFTECLDKAEESIDKWIWEWWYQ